MLISTATLRYKPPGVVPRHRTGIPIAVNVTSEDQIDVGITRVVETFRRLDILVCDAGIQIIPPSTRYCSRTESRARGASIRSICGDPRGGATYVAPGSRQHYLYWQCALARGPGGQSPVPRGQPRLVDAIELA